MGSESQWHKWYGRSSWLKRQRHQLRLQPLCQMCLPLAASCPQLASITSSPIAGDYTKFRLGQLQSLCASCHNSTKKIIEQRGYDPAIGADGMPLDPRHPIYRYDKR